MSKKILIDFEVLTQTLNALGVGLNMAHPYRSVCASAFSDAIAKISTAIKEAEEKRFSILEWHPMSEKPKDLSDILVRDINGAIFDSFAYYYEKDWLIQRGDKAQIVEWAYLPE